MNKNHAPLISIIIPAYNHQDYIEECLTSIAIQDYSQKELIIINDGSTDNTDSVISACLIGIEKNFKRVLYLNQENQGLVKTLNNAISISEGEYLYINASDDYLHRTDALSLLSLKMQQEKNAALIWADTIIVNSASERVAWDLTQRQVPLKTPKAFTTTNQFFTSRRSDITHSKIGSYETLIAGNYISNAPLIRKSCLIEIGGYNEDCGFEDWSMWLTLAKKYRLIYIDEPLGSYRWHDNNTIKNIPKKILSNFYKFYVKEKQYCINHGYLDIWKKTSKNLKTKNPIFKILAKWKKSLLKRVKKISPFKSIPRN